MSDTDLPQAERPASARRTLDGAVTAYGQQPSPKLDFADDDVQAVLAATRTVVEAAVGGKPPQIDLKPEINDAPAFGIFVTLRRPTSLRACRGRWGVGNESLGPLLMEVARDTARLDHRFPSITVQELPYLAIDVSLMYDPANVEATGEDRIEAIQVGQHGLVINHPHGRGLLLPHVATEAGWDAKTFLDHLAQKAGLPPDTWRRDPQSQLMTFRTKLWASDPPKHELDIQSLQSARLHRLLEAANGLLHDQPLQDPPSQLLVQNNEQLFGIHLQSDAGASATAVGAGHSLLELTEAAVRSLKEQLGQLKPNRAGSDTIKRVTLLWQPIELKAADYPARHMLLSQSAVRIRTNDRWGLVLPEKNQRFDTVGKALMSVQLNSSQWQKQEKAEKVSVNAFAVMHFEAREAPPPSQSEERAPARAGQFYPADATEMTQATNSYLDKYPAQTRSPYRAVMLPHAGWTFCGDTIAKTLSRVQVPKTAIIIGPKHTPHGASWSVAPHRRWRFPGMTVPIATDLVKRLVDDIPDLACEPDAHRMEHGSEVLIPFLHRLQPALEFVPIVMGQSSYEATASFAARLAIIIQEMDSPPLLIISSDMNHFSPEPENRRLDHLALDAMVTGDPRALYDTCRAHQISMCGLFPAVTIMQSLIGSKPLELELVDYCNSAAVTSDMKRVVGYAGVLIR